MQGQLGSWGENYFAVLISKFDGGRPSRFRPCFLGDTWPAADFLVQLEGVPSVNPYFFVQVKTTRRDFTTAGKRLPISGFTKDHVVRLAAYPAPTYVVGIHEPRETAWILAVTGQTQKPLSSLPTVHPLNEANRGRLYDEVRDFWKSERVHPIPSVFVTDDWT